MKKFNLTITTDLQEESQVQHLAQQLAAILQSNCTFDLVKNQEIQINGTFLKDFDSISQAAELTDRICTPWTMTFLREDNEIELEFSLNTDVVFRESSFNTIQKAAFKTTS
ncbi:MAG: hypothetical protein COB60_05185 [Flavobacteriaceae bacterium]|nr:MAG: hypothetical protein COB60_05185 [Flavobacteriaceae bacterium]